MFCEVCGAELPDNVSVCTFCGSPVRPQDQNSSVATQAGDFFSYDGSGSSVGGDAGAYSTYDAPDAPSMQDQGDYATGDGYLYQDDDTYNQGDGTYIDSQQPYDYMAADDQNMGYQQPYDYMAADNQGDVSQQPYDYLETDDQDQGYQQPYDYMSADSQGVVDQQPYDYQMSSDDNYDQQPYDYQMSSDGNYIDYGNQNAGGYQDYGYDNDNGNGAGYDGYADDNVSYGGYSNDGYAIDGDGGYVAADDASGAHFGDAFDGTIGTADDTGLTAQNDALTETIQRDPTFDANGEVSPYRAALDEVEPEPEIDDAGLFITDDAYDIGVTELRKPVGGTEVETTSNLGGETDWSSFGSNQKKQDLPVVSEREGRRKSRSGFAIAFLVIFLVAAAGGAFLVFVLPTFAPKVTSSATSESTTYDEIVPVEASIPLQVYSPGMNSNGSRIPVRVFGFTLDGNEVDEVNYINENGVGLKLFSGEYEVQLAGSPINSEGAIYVVPGNSISVSVDKIGVVNVSQDKPWELYEEPVEETTREDIEQAYQFVITDPEREKVADQLLNKALLRIGINLNEERDAEAKAEFEAAQNANSNNNTNTNTNTQPSRPTNYNYNYDYDYSYDDDSSSTTDTGSTGTTDSGSSTGSTDSGNTGGGFTDYTYGGGTDDGGSTGSTDTGTDTSGGSYDGGGDTTGGSDTGTTDTSGGGYDAGGDTSGGSDYSGDSTDYSGGGDTGGGDTSGGGDAGGSDAGGSGEAE